MSAAEVLPTLEHDISVPRGVHWQDFAACKGNTELFFARKAERPQARERREAKAHRLCAVCPVQVPCRSFARENHEYGYWGGENEEDRHLLGFTVSAPIGIRARQAGGRTA
jgi:WhiB family transcriptional regulator, redox-sensing transcriptional regulator